MILTLLLLLALFIYLYRRENRIMFQSYSRRDIARQAAIILLEMGLEVDVVTGKMVLHD